MLNWRFILCAYFHLITHICSIGITFWCEYNSDYGSSLPILCWKINGFPLNKMIIMVMSLVNASICTLNSHTNTLNYYYHCYSYILHHSVIYWKPSNVSEIGSFSNRSGSVDNVAGWQLLDQFFFLLNCQFHYTAFFDVSFSFTSNRIFVSVIFDLSKHSISIHLTKLPIQF